MSYEIPFKVYCEQRCPYKDNRQLEPERWERLEPCINCPAEGFSDKKPITQNCPTCEQLLAEVKRLEAELAEERRYWK